jgi:hypothetical protein
MGLCFNLGVAKDEIEVAGNLTAIVDPVQHHQLEHVDDVGSNVEELFDHRIRSTGWVWIADIGETDVGKKIEIVEV